MFEGVKTLLKGLTTQASPEVVAGISGYYAYAYDGPNPTRQIADGGQDMFDDGNQVVMTSQWL